MLSMNNIYGKDLTEKILRAYIHVVINEDAQPVRQLREATHQIMDDIEHTLEFMYFNYGLDSTHEDERYLSDFNDFLSEIESSDNHLHRVLNILREHNDIRRASSREVNRKLQSIFGHFRI